MPKLNKINLTQEDFLEKLNEIQREVESINPAADPLVILDYSRDPYTIRERMRVKFKDGCICIYNKECKSIDYDEYAYEVLVKTDYLIRLSKLKKKIAKHPGAQICIYSQYANPNLEIVWCGDDTDDDSHDDPRIVIIVTDPDMINKIYEMHKGDDCM